MRTTPSNLTTFRRLRRLLAGTVLAASVFAIIGGTARPAHAATVVTGCFVMPDGYAPPYPLTVQLLVWTGSGWNAINSRTTTTGCVWIPMTLGYENHYAILYVNDHNFGGSLVGWSPDYAYPGSYSAWVGVGFLQYSCNGRVNAC